MRRNEERKKFKQQVKWQLSFAKSCLIKQTYGWRETDK